MKKGVIMPAEEATIDLTNKRDLKDVSLSDPVVIDSEAFLKESNDDVVKPVQGGVSRFTDFDICLFKSGNHFKLYEKLGSHMMTVNGVKGTYFAVWAPNAARVSVIADFNGWNSNEHVLSVRWDSSGIWEGFIPGARKGSVYKYHITSKNNGYVVEKRDPFAFHCEKPPCTASIVWDVDYSWKDKGWIETREKHNALNAPCSIYEMHFGSWRLIPQDP